MVTISEMVKQEQWISAAVSTITSYDARQEVCERLRNERAERGDEEAQDHTERASGESLSCSSIHNSASEMGALTACEAKE